MNNRERKDYLLHVAEKKYEEMLKLYQKNLPINALRPITVKSSILKRKQEEKIKL